MAQSETYRPKFEVWVRTYAPPLYRYAYRLSGDHQIAEDLMQETFLEAWRNVDKLQDDNRVSGWLFQILRHRFSHFLRDTRGKRETRRISENGDNHPPDVQLPPLEHLAERDAMQMALNSLSPLVRQTFLMVFMEGRACREVAEILEIPLGTVLSRTDTARKALREVLGGQEASPTLASALSQPVAGAVDVSK